MPTIYKVRVWSYSGKCRTGPFFFILLLKITLDIVCGRMYIVINDGNKHLTGEATMEKAAQIIKEMMAQYDASKAQWVQRFGSDQGFDKWFSDQVNGKK